MTSGDERWVARRILVMAVPSRASEHPKEAEMTFQVINRGVLALTFLVLVLGACSDDSTSPHSATAATSQSETPSATPPPPSCPNWEGGSCLGPLRPGKPYTTVEFNPAITHEAPSEGSRTMT